MKQASVNVYFVNTRSAALIALSIVAALLIALADTAQATTYYYNGGGSAHLTASWDDNPGGPGNAPLNFGAGHTFVIQNGFTATLTNNWTINAGSGLLVQTGGEMNAGSVNPSLTFELNRFADLVRSGFSGRMFSSSDADSRRREMLSRLHQSADRL